ncbi:MAG TPA: nucleotidyl transferase AbiEii/AbiGii toxin family protein [bacterium]|nr:nucleotidyl transferase AbiEii/AbiGii toxin family protein [bacterium]HOL67285.1 nucleotidyl transferase AbiEii/AbiGii toxin family protein [bacterium]HPP12558.1 nucleotidyl transferase AbiEii/AbiGii toxin family protein [bacterium]
MQRYILTDFSSLPDARHFYLTGGTALSEFCLGHRRSFDLDLFTREKNFLSPFFASL